MKILKRILKYSILIISTYFVIVIISILTCKHHTNTNPLPPFYLKGVYHVHSIFSDGSGDIDEITRAAADLKHQFIILTDHGRPNLPSSAATQWLNTVLLIGASEFSLHSGHLAAMGYQVPAYYFPPEPQEAINDVNSDQGATFISHPFDTKIPWTNWQVHDFSGIEILSTYSSAKKMNVWQLILFPGTYLLKPNYAFLNTLKYPHHNIAKWDAFSQYGQYTGIYALDAHANLKMTEKIQLSLPSYKSMFRILTVYVMLDQELDQDAIRAAAMIISAIRRGRFFNVIEGLASANGFQCFFYAKEGGKIEMGGKTSSEKGTIGVELPFQFATNVIIKKDGRTFKKILNNQKKKIELEVKQAGVYRLEVYINKGRFKKLPWIITNPFYINKNFIQPEIKTIRSQKLLVKDRSFFHIEKNHSSQGQIYHQQNETNEFITGFRYHLKKDIDKKDFWVALACRKKLDFSKYQGIVFAVKSDQKMRFWAEFRTHSGQQEKWYRHSFLADNKWQQVAIPFARFPQIVGDTSPAQLDQITSLFLAINNAITYKDSKGKVEFKNIGLY